PALAERAERTMDAQPEREALAQEHPQRWRGGVRSTRQVHNPAGWSGPQAMPSTTHLAIDDGRIAVGECRRAEPRIRGVPGEIGLVAVDQMPIHAGIDPARREVERLEIGEKDTAVGCQA